MLGRDTDQFKMRPYKNQANSSPRKKKLLKLKILRKFLGINLLTRSFHKFI